MARSRSHGGRDVRRVQERLRWPGGDIKGDSRALAPIGQPSPIEVGPQGNRVKLGLRVWPVNAAMIKEELYRWLRMERPTEESAEPYPPGYCHFPKYSEEFFKLVTRVVKGYRRPEWQKTRDRNEALDCRCYARAAAAVYNTRDSGLAEEHCLSELESSMSSVQIEQKSYEMPPREGISIAHFLTVADIERSARYYEKVFGARILSLGDGNAPGYLQLANIWMILNVGGGPTPDKPTVTLSVPDPNHINSFMNFRVADIQACYELWKSRGAEFITEPIPKYGETRCYIRDPDGYIIEVGQSTDLTYG